MASLGYNSSMTPYRLFICGGAWTGKTARATQLASQQSEVIWIGTAANTVSGINERITTLKAARPSTWVNVDAPFNLVESLADARKKYPNSLIVVDSVSQWIGNEIAKLSAKHDEWQLSEAIMREVDDLSVNLKSNIGSLIVVSSDFGQSPPAQEPASRVLRMCVGRANQQIANIAVSIELMMAGVVFSTTKKEF